MKGLYTSNNPSVKQKSVCVYRYKQNANLLFLQFLFLFLALLAFFGMSNFACYKRPAWISTKYCIQTNVKFTPSFESFGFQLLLLSQCNRKVHRHSCCASCACEILCDMQTLHELSCGCASCKSCANCKTHCKTHTNS